MGKRFEELGRSKTPMGDLVLRRREALDGGEDIFEVKLGEAFLMSSRFTGGEVALAKAGLAALTEPALDVVVGGLGLGYTAAAALEDPRVNALLVIERMPEVIAWHQGMVVPLGVTLGSNRRCRMIEADFFEMAIGPGGGFDPATPHRQFHAILLDIDHSPYNLLDPRHAVLYDPAGLRRMARFLRPGGVFAMWSNDPPEEAFLAALSDVFVDVKAHIARVTEADNAVSATNTVYVGRLAAGECPPAGETVPDHPRL